MPRSKLIRNLKPGDRFTIIDVDGKRTATVTVQAVQETRMGYFTRKRRWEVIVQGGYPWWWGCSPMVGYSDSRIELA